MNTPIKYQLIVPSYVHEDGTITDTKVLFDSPDFKKVLAAWNEGSGNYGGATFRKMIPGRRNGLIQYDVDEDWTPGSEGWGPHRCDPPCRGDNERNREGTETWKQ